MEQMAEPDMENLDNVIYIKMFGQFSIEQSGISISDSSNRTHQLWNLLEYLIAFRHKSITQDELINTLWPDATSENPTNALKNLIYRIRTVLQNQGFEDARDMVLFTNGSYCWNNSLNCVVDTERFEQLFNDRLALTDDEQRVEYNMRAIELYKGDLLPGSSYEKWVISLSAYFRSIYFRFVYDTLAILQKLGRHDEVYAICESAIRVDAFEERIYVYMIESLLAQNKRSRALDCYNNAIDLFYRELGVKPSENMRALFHRIAGTLNGIEMDINRIKDDLQEQLCTVGAFFCDYEVFKNMYRLEARSASRNGQTVFLALLTLRDNNSAHPQAKHFVRAMGVLEHCIKAGLRRGDVVSRYSSTQYVVMLQTLTYENSHMVMERISTNFYKEYKGRDMSLSTELQPLTPIEHQGKKV